MIMSNESNQPAEDAPKAVEQPAQPPSGATAAHRGDVPKPGDGAKAGGDGANARKILIGVLVFLVIGIAAYGVYYVTSGPSKVAAGDCVSVTEENEKSYVATFDCSADKASYKVGKVVEAGDATCPEEGLYTEVVPDGGTGRLCLLPNMAEGACYKPDDGTGFVKTECAGPETIKVVKVVEGSRDTEACPDQAGMSYPEPPVTYCLAPAEL
jgi:hypothetical protein